LFSISKSVKRNSPAVGEEEAGPFKVVVSSVVYPVIK
jgi:hypothetical protein